jgi:nucleoside-diphosphate-sugar epimerase
MKVFVTGCAGLLGANYARHLLQNGHEVIGIDDLSGGYKAFVPKGEKFSFVKLNLERRKKLVDLFEEHKPDLLFHFAAYAAEGLSPFIRNYNYRNNLICSANLINECIKQDTKVIFNEVAETVQKVGKKYGYEVPIEHGEPRHEVKHAYCDHTKAKTMLKFQDGTHLEELVDTIFVWAMKQPNRKVKNMEYEVTKDIYDYWRN